MKRIISIIPMIVFLSVSVAGAAVIHVPGDYSTIQAGINAAQDGDTVAVAPGTYKGEGNRNIELFSKAIAVLGSGPDTCLIDCQNETHGFYCHHGELETTVLSGFSVMYSSSSGIRCEQSSPAIENIHVDHCQSGISCSYSDASVRNCIMNTDGTGLHCSYSTAVAEDCVITNCNSSGADIWYSTLRMNRCTISNNSNDLGGAGIMNWQSFLMMEYCVVENNNLYGTDILYGAGVFSFGNYLEMHHCVISNNTIHSDPPYYEPGEGAGIFIQSNASIENCLITGNTAENGNIGGVYCASGDNVTIRNCTITDNENRGIDTGSSYTSIWDCTIWDESRIGPNSEISYCDLMNFVQGEGNISQDPLFVAGPDGDYYLSQTASGQSVQSPCVDAGTIDASACRIGDETMDQRTTRIDRVTDSNIIDLGYHYSGGQIPPTPTPTPTPVPPTPTILPLGVDLQISGTHFVPCDLFLLQANITNPGPETYQSLPFVVVLEAGSQYFWYPDWSTEFRCWGINLGIGTIPVEILRFHWPVLTGSGSGATFYSALLNNDYSELIGQWDSVSFSWSE